MTTPVDEDAELAELVEQNPARARIFEDYNLDFCCGGDQSLREACDESGLSIDEIREALELVDARSETDGPEQLDSAADLVDFIVDHHHEFLREELAPLGELVEKVERVHGDGHPELHEVAEAFEELAREIPKHLSEEEQIVFPAVRRLEAGDASEAQLQTAREVLSRLEEDHDDTADLLEQIREATDEFEVPDDACPSYENMLERLERLEEDLHLHVHRENNVLFEMVRERAEPAC
ncbi:MAG: iron-sulfur cluster repair di-iron protein [Bradymonadaceae bacterium]